LLNITPSGAKEDFASYKEAAKVKLTKNVAETIEVDVNRSFYNADK
jgi:hypothetical protein